MQENRQYLKLIWIVKKIIKQWGKQAGDGGAGLK